MNNDVLNVMNSLRIVGRSILLQEAVSAAIQAAPFDVNVLVVGENGSGKEVFHKILHNYSPRRHKKCVAVNCGALPEGTITSELFGHTKGSFTGATADRKGFFEEADGGTIFLDEIGELPLETQARLLRVLETGEYQRMGSSDVRKCNVRVVAATNRDLHRAIEEGRFREDLFYRLSTITIRVPALRDRQEDIHLLFRKFANDIASQYNIPPISLDNEALKLLLAYRWPGNVRQLLHLVEELSIVREERIITADILKRYLPVFESGMSFGGSDNHNSDMFIPGEKAALYQLIFNMQHQIEEIKQHIGINTTTQAPPARTNLALGPGTIITPPPSVNRTEEPTTDIYIGRPNVEFVEQEAVEVESSPSATTHAHPTLAEVEKNAIAAALSRNKGNKRKASDELGISERTIHRKIIEYGL